MEEIRTYTVYYHLNKINGKVYFGITARNPERRWANGRNYKKNKHFASAIKKYGWDGFHHRIMIDGLTKETAELMEVNLIKWSGSQNRTRGYNKDSGGGITAMPSAETRLKMSVACRKKWDFPEYRERMCRKMSSPEILAKIAIAHEKIKDTEEYRTRQTESKKKIWQRDGYREKMSDIRTEMWKLPEYKEKMSKANKQTWERNGHREKMSASRKKRVMCIETCEVFPGAIDAAKWLGVDRSCVSDACNGKSHTCGGYHWKHVKEEKHDSIGENQIACGDV